MTEQTNVQRLALPLLLVVFVALATAYSFVVPLGEAPDEVSHIGYVQYLVENHRLPPAEEIASGEAHQPPLYYLVAAMMTVWLGDQPIQIIANPDWRIEDRSVPNVLLHTRQEGLPYHGAVLVWHLVRLLSVVLGAVTIWATYHLARDVFSDHTLALAAAAFVAFLPQFTYLSAMVNNDNLVIALSTLTLLFFVRHVHTAQIVDVGILGMLLGLSILAKLSALPLAVALAGGWMLIRRKVALHQRFGEIVAMFSVAALISLPWVAYNSIVFDDPINWARFLQVTPRTESFTLFDGTTYALRLYESFWGKFGGATHLPLPGILYFFFAILSAVSFVGVVYLVVDWRARRLPTRVAQILGVFALLWALLIAAHFRLMINILGMDQARHIFVGLPSLGIVMAAGILRLVPRYNHLIARSWIAGMMLIGWGVLACIAMTYHSPALAVGMFTPRPSKTPIDFGAEIRVLDYRVEWSPVARGESLAVQIEWQAIQDISENYWLLLQLTDTSGNVVTQQEGVPSRGKTTTDWWRSGQTFSSSHMLKVPLDIPPGEYELQLGVHPFGRWEWLPVRGSAMITLVAVQVE